MANMLSWLTGRGDAEQPPPFVVDDGQPSLRAYNPTPSERMGNWIQDLLMSGGAQAYPAGHVAHGVRDLLSMSPLGIGMSAADLRHAKSAGDPMGAAAAAIGMVPGAKPARAAVSAADKGFVAGLDELFASIKNKTVPMFKPQVADTGFLANQPVVTSHSAKPLVDSTDFALGSIDAVLNNKAAFSIYDKANGLHHVFDAKTGQLAGSSKNKSWADTFENQWGSLVPETQQFYLKDAAKNPLLKPAVLPNTKQTKAAFDLSNPYDYKENKYGNFDVLHTTTGEVHAVAHNEEEAIKAMNALHAADTVNKKPATAASYWDWKPEEVAALKKQKPVLDYATDYGSGTAHVFDAVTGKTIKEGLASHTQAQEYIKQAENFYKPAIEPAPINNIQEQAIDLPGLPSRIPAKPPWLNQSAVLPEDAREAARLAGDYTTPAYRGIRLQSAADDFGPVFKGDQHFSTASPELADMYSSYLSKHPGANPPQHSYQSGASGVPLWLNTSNYHVADAQGKTWSYFNDKAVAEAKRQGKPGVVIHNVWDEPNSTTSLPSPQTIYITFPEGQQTVKSKFAAMFDPKSKDISKALVGGAGLGAGGYAMQPREASARAPQQPQMQQPQALAERINQIIDSLQWGDQWQGRMRLPLEKKVNSMLGESVWPPLR